MSKSQLISIFALERVSKIVSQIIRQLQRFKITQSGEDSGLENTWDEICVQLQGEYSFHWDVYEETFFNLVQEKVNKLASHEQLAIWLQTSYGEDEDDLESKYDPSEVCHHIKSIIFQKAGDWSNKKIRKYLERG